MSRIIEILPPATAFCKERELARHAEEARMRCLEEEQAAVDAEHRAD